MPIFDYCCETCNTRKEVLVLKSDTIVNCPKCKNAPVMKRAMPAVGLLRTNFHDSPSPKDRTRHE